MNRGRAQSVCVCVCICTFSGFGGESLNFYNVNFINIYSVRTTTLQGKTEWNCTYYKIKT